MRILVGILLLIASAVAGVAKAALSIHIKALYNHSTALTGCSGLVGVLAREEEGRFSRWARRLGLKSKEEIQVFADEPHAAFLKAIAREPDDDTVRLAYADWLDEHGDPDRAQFIRLQIGATTALPLERNRMNMEANNLLAKHYLEWIPQRIGGGEEYEFDRGFVSGVWLSGSRFAEPYIGHGHTFPTRLEWLLAQAPTLTALHLDQTTRPANLRKLLDIPAVKQLKRLSVRAFAPNESVELAVAITQSKNLENLRALGFHGVTPPEAIRELGRATQLKNLTELHVGSSLLHAEAAEAIGTGEAFRKLKVLNLASSHISNGGVAALRLEVKGSVLSNLEELDLSGADISVSSAHRLAGFTGTWKVLKLDGDRYTRGIGPEGLAILLQSNSIRSLKELHLRWNRIGNDGARLIAQSDKLGLLEYLGLADNEIYPDGFQAIAESKTLRNLIEMGWWDNPHSTYGAPLLEKLLERNRSARR